jgi:tRNA pseudouridine38-40 synthase
LRLRLTLAYDGTDFEGWQVQPRAGSRTVQGVLEGCLSRLCGGAAVPVAGAGRTDAGVHALGQVASFDLPREMAPAALGRALNALLPADVRVLGVEPAAPGFHARRSALSKHYRYVADTGPVQLPQLRRGAAHVPGPLDAEALRAVAALYLGRQDFASLASSGSSVKTSVRSVTRSDVAYDGEVLVYDVEASGFLRKMVRSMVGGLLAAGRGQRSVADLARALERADRRGWPPPAEARGLTLVSVAYAPPEARVLA